MVNWTWRMVKTLRENFHKCSFTKLSEMLGVSVTSVRAKAVSMGLRKEVSYFLGNREYTYPEILELAERCKEETYIKVALSLGVYPQKLMMFLQQHGLLEAVKAHKERKRQQERAIRLQYQKNVSNPSDTYSPPKSERVAEGSYYWVACEDAPGAYKALESGDEFDQRIFDEGRYFNSESDALVHSRRIARGKKEP